MPVPDTFRNEAAQGPRGGGAYARAGVDLDARAAFVSKLRSMLGPPVRDETLAGVGPFSSLFRLAGYRRPVLAASTDGVGTKLRIAVAMDSYDTIGQDLVHHCVNDILTSGAEPLFFLDYIGSSELSDAHKLDIVAGMQAACRAHRCELIGGETADMPGTYAPGDFDLVGFIVGAVESDHVIDGSRVTEGDVLVGLPSSGLHTNGYSLVRKVFGIGAGAEDDRRLLDASYDGLDGTLGEALLAVHRSYLDDLRPLLGRLRGIAHITGGGIAENLARAMPAGLQARVDRGAWRVPALFSLIQRRGRIVDADMFRTFNMGLGMIVVVARADAADVTALPGARVVGEIVERAGGETPVVIE